MPNFRPVANGYIHEAVDDSAAATIFKAIKILRTDAQVDFSILAKGYVAIEILRYANALTGREFAAFLEANYNNGRGDLAMLVRDIVHYLNGRCGHQVVLTSISIQEGKFRIEYPAEYSQKTHSGSPVPLLKDGDTVSNYDLYRLIAGIGPVNLGRILLLLGGKDYNG